MGTSGIVEPMSEEALCQSISLEIHMAAVQGHPCLVITPGNYGEEFLQSFSPLQGIPAVKCSNFVGHALDSAVLNGFTKVMLVGHIGKFCKLACGVMNTHSAIADARAEVFAAHAALCGASRALVQALMQAATTDEMLALLKKISCKSRCSKAFFKK